MAIPDPVTVWMVHLARGQADKDVKGTLSLDDEALMFTGATGEGAPARLPFTSIVRAKRLRGSPVLVVDWELEGTRNRTAFYFTQPPPLHPAAGPDPSELAPERTSAFPMIRRSGKRKAQRTNAQYLQTSGISKKELIQGWAREVSSRIASGTG